MKHELLKLTEKQQETISEYTIRTLNSYCKRWAFENSKLPFPLAMGFDENDNLLIENLPDLGNVLLFGETGMADYYMQILYLQLQNVRHKFFHFKMTVLDCSILKELSFLSDIEPNDDHITGESYDFVDVLNRIEREAKLRRTNSNRKFPHRIFFIYVHFLRISDTDCEQLRKILNDNLNSIGIQIIFCAADGGSTVTMLPFAEYFQTTIGGRTAGLHEYSSLGSHQFIMKREGNLSFLNARYGEEIPDPDAGKQPEAEIPTPPTPMQIAFSYWRGKDKDLNKAIAIYESEIEKGNARAAVWLARLYAIQYRDYNKEKLCYQRAAEMGDVEAQRKLKEIERDIKCTLCGKEFGEYEQVDTYFSWIGEYEQVDAYYFIWNRGIKYKDKTIRIKTCAACTDRVLDILLPLCAEDPYDE